MRLLFLVINGLSDRPWNVDIRIIGINSNLAWVLKRLVENIRRRVLINARVMRIIAETSINQIPTPLLLMVIVSEGRVLGALVHVHVGI